MHVFKSFPKIKKMLAIERSQPIAPSFIAQILSCNKEANHLDAESNMCEYIKRKI